MKEIESVNLCELNKFSMNHERDLKDIKDVLTGYHAIFANLEQWRVAMSEQLSSFKSDYDAHCLSVIDLKYVIDELVKSMPKETPLSNKKIQESIGKLSDRIDQLDNAINDDIVKINTNAACDDLRLQAIERFMHDERFIHIMSSLDDLDQEFKRRALLIVQEALSNDQA